ncbi:MAG: histidine kinase dimerization/phospho-acceptor domain-containing protein [Verrucomicrobiota bacterium]
MKLSASQYDQLFPFRLELAKCGTIVAAGNALRKAIPIAIGDSVFKHFSIDIPQRIESFQPESLLGTLVLLTHRESDFALKGEILESAETDEEFLFICSPVVKNATNLRDWGLNFRDFPVLNDPTDFLFILNAQESATAGATKTAHSLEEKNETLEYRNHLFTSLVGNLPCGGAILLKDDYQVLISGGEDLPTISGRSEERYFHKDGVPLEQILGAHAAEVLNHLSTTAQEHSRFELETTDSIYRCAVSKLEDPLYAKHRWLLIFQNITDELRNQSQAERLQRLDSVGHLAGGIAHDFNNYLTGILGNISIARSNPTLMQDALDDAESACEASRQLTRQLLTFSKGGDPVKSKGDLEALVHNAAKFSLSGSNISWSVKACPRLKHANFDAGQISQVINNLCVNASQALQSQDNGEIKIKLSNEVAQKHGVLLPGDYLRVDIIDNGP